MSHVSLSRDPFARTESIRRTVSRGECAECGQPARFEYGTEQDAVRPRSQWQGKVFCSKSCQRAYTR